MNKQEIDQHIGETIEKVKTQKALIASLETQALDVAAQGDVKKVVATKKELTAARELLDGLELVLKSYEKKSKDYTEKQEPEAAKIRKRLAEELWPAATAEYDKLKALHGELAPILEKITGLNNEMEALANQHKRLIGDRIYTPRIPIPAELYSVMNVKLGVAPSHLDVRTASHREMQHLKDQFEQQRPVVSKILKRIKSDWPLCPACGAELLAQRYEVSEDGTKGFLEMRCAKHPGQWISATFPARPVLSEAGLLISTKGPVAPADITGSVPYKIESHGPAEMPSLTHQPKGGKKTP
jgi:hypothetical protein